MVNSDSVYIFKWNGNRYPDWPKRVNGSTYTHPVIADLNNDGIPEIIYATGAGYLHIFEPDGSPLLTEYIGYFPYISVGDINGDSTLEIVATIRNTTSANIIALNIYGDTLWKDATFETNINSPLIADIDRDGKYDIVATFANGVYIWKNGLTTRIYVPLSDPPRGPLLLSDINGDGCPEIITGTLYNGAYAIDKDGNIVEKWSTSGKTYRAGVTENNGKIFLNGSNHDTRYSLIYGFKKDSIIPGFPFRYSGYSYSSPTVADIDGDSMCDLVFTNAGGQLYIWETDIPLVSGWHKDYYDNENTSFMQIKSTNIRRISRNRKFEFYILRNPAVKSVKLFISTNTDGKIQIFDLLGRRVKEKDIRRGFRGILSLHLSAAGVYFIRFHHATKKFILLK